MTNLEKFKEIFGFEPDTSMGVHKCPDMEPETACPYYEKTGCHCEDWWNEEYDPRNMTPPLLSKDTPHMVNIFSCPFFLPCGWCEKRNMLCIEVGGSHYE